MTKEKTSKNISSKKKNKKPGLLWNWTAFFLGPLWYIAHGIWSRALIAIIVILMSGFILIIPAALYCALHFDEDLKNHKKNIKNRTATQSPPS